MLRDQKRPKEIVWGSGGDTDSRKDSNRHVERHLKSLRKESIQFIVTMSGG